MMYKSKLLPYPFIKLFLMVVSWLLKRKFNKLKIHEIDIKPNHSYLLMLNHFSFIDGFLAYYLIYKTALRHKDFKGAHFMILDKQLEKNLWMCYMGAYSITRGSRAAVESLKYTTDLLNQPGNIVVMYPQGNLESQHVRKIEVQPGLQNIVSKIQGNCQILWCSNIIEYFESFKPTCHFHMLDCGTNHQFQFGQLQEQINVFHAESIKKHIRFTKED